MTILVLIGMVFVIISDLPWEAIFKLSASTAAGKSMYITLSCCHSS